MKLLLTGFETAGSTERDLSWNWVAGVDEVFGESHSVTCLKLPATWDGCFEPLQAALKRDWDAVLCVASKRVEQVAVERLALNEADVTLKDADGRRPRCKTIDPDGEEGYWTGLPYRDLAIRLNAAAMPAVVSHTAGRGLANFVFYRLMRALAQASRAVVGGLVQVPLNRSEEIVEAERTQLWRCVLESLENAPARKDSLLLDPKRLETLRWQGLPTAARGRAD